MTPFQFIVLMALTYSCETSLLGIVTVSLELLDVNFQGFVGFGLVLVGAELVPQHGQHFIHAVGHAQKFLHIDLEDIVLVPMLLIRTCLADLQRVKQGCGIFTTVVVSCKHIRSHRLAEASGAADADELLPGVDDSVRLFDQTGLIHIDLGVQAFLKALAARIQIAARAGTSHRANIIMFIIL